MTNGASNLANKRAVWSAMQAIAESTPGALRDRLANIYHPDAAWRGSHPWNEIQGLEAIERVVWGPLLHSLPDLERRDSIVIGGHYDGRDYVGMVGHLVGSFRRAWNGIPANDQVVYLRYGEVHQMAAGKIVQSTVLVDILDFIRQAGFWPVAPSLGYEGMWPGPISGDGVLLSPQDPGESVASLELTLSMQTALGQFPHKHPGTREQLLTIHPHAKFWHPKMMWYGPSGIGTTRALEGFVDYHQLPFRVAFPERLGGQHYIRIGDGKYSATGGWPSVTAMHSGGGWVGMPATGKPVAMRVMDFYLADAGLIRENWVPIDVIHLLLQMGLDVLARVREQLGKQRG